MKLRVRQIIETRPDDAGEAFRWHFKSGDQDVYVEMTLWQANSLMARLAQSGAVAAELFGSPVPSVHPDGEEHLQTVRCTHADASFGPDGQPLVVLRFGRTALAARLSTHEARALGEQLLQLAAGTPSSTAVQ